MLKRAEVLRLTRHMDKIANELQENPAQFGFSAEAADRYAYDLDVAADRLERMVGIERDADVAMHDKDEDYMSTFDHAGPVDNQMDGDEPYMRMFEDDTYDQLIDHPELTPGNSMPSGEDSSNTVDAGEAWWSADASDWRNW